VTDVAAGDGHTCALMEAGGIMCWGSDFNGQLGDGEPNSSETTVRVLGL
jgi:alpha-tubulin suppressor-like RCC1 family protein